MRSDARWAAAILGALRTGPCVAGELALRIGRSGSGQIAGTLTSLISTGKAIEIGTLAQARAVGMSVGESPNARLTTRVYALPGTPLLPALSGAVPKADNTRRAGSGVIAGRKLIRGYRYGWGF